MPRVDRYFLAPGAPGPQFDPSELVRVGPVVQVLVTLPPSLRPPGPNAPAAAGLALIDTGATKTGVSPDALKSLGIGAIGVTELMTANGKVKKNLYPATLILQGDK